ncbi:hypothetical protein E2542_SST31261 [Spatholobus suberectus]|nr:hypothetical protein E2542_SST31261 [Spatholobus suberectus]
MPERIDVPVNETVHESVDVNLNDPVNQSFGVVDGKGKEPVCEEVPIIENDKVDPTVCPNEVYVSDGYDNTNYVQLENVSDSSDSDSEYASENGDANNEDANECFCKVYMFGYANSSDLNM